MFVNRVYMPKIRLVSKVLQDSSLTRILRCQSRHIVCLYLFPPLLKTTTCWISYGIHDAYSPQTTTVSCEILLYFYLPVWKKANFWHWVKNARARHESSTTQTSPTILFGRRFPNLPQQIYIHIIFPKDKSMMYAYTEIHVFTCMVHNTSFKKYRKDLHVK